MTEERAREILGAVLRDDGTIYHGLDSADQSLWKIGSEKIWLYGVFTFNQLKALAWIMENKK